MRRQSPRPSARHRALRIAGILLALIVVFALGQHFNRTTTTAKRSHAPKAEKVEKSSPRVASSTTASSSVQGVATTPKTADQHLTRVLSNLTQIAGENAETRSGGRTTYSRFYQTQGTWYWEMTANTQNAPVEVAKVTGATQDGRLLKLDMTSQVYHPDQTYRLEFQWLDRAAGEYKLHTTFENIDGNYTIGETEDVADAENDTASMSWTLGSGEGIEDESTRTDNGATTYSDFTQDDDGDWYWTLSSDKRGNVEFGKVTDIQTQDGVPVELRIQSKLDKSYGTTYTVHVSYNDDLTSYHLVTAQDNINGKYTIDDYSTGD